MEEILQVTININLQTGVITVTDESSREMKGGITRAQLDQIATDPAKGLRWRLSVFQYPGSNCWVVQTPGGDRLFCTP